MMNSIIETRMQHLSKYHSIIDEKKCIRTLKNTCFHVMSVNCKQINDKMKNCILFEC